MIGILQASNQIPRWPLIILPLLLITSVLDFAGTALVFPLIELIGGEADTESHDIVKIINDILQYTNLPTDKGYIIFYILIIFISKAIFFVTYRWIVSDSILQWMVDTRSRLYQLLFASSFSEVNEDKSRLLNAYTTQCDAAHGAIVISFELWLGFIVTFSSILLANFISWQIFLLLIALGLLLGGIIKITMVLSLRYGQELADANKRLLSIMGQAVDRYRYLKSTSSYSRLSMDLLTIAQKAKNLQVRHAFINASTSSLTEPLAVITILLLFTFGSLLGMEKSVLIMQSLVMYRLLTRILPLSSQLQVFNKALASLKYVQATLELLGERETKENKPSIDSNIEQIEFNDVSFAFGRNKVLEKVNFSFKKSEVLLLMGRSGSGKTTIINLLCGLFIPDSGFIKVNNQTINDIDLEEYRSKIGLLSQDSTLFNMSLRENLTLRNRNVGDNELKDWIEKLDLTNMFDEGIIDLDQKINELSSNLSGGQKQRLCFIREIVSEPELFILDEPTSALDINSKGLILRYLQEYKSNALICIITHDLDLWNHADLIYHSETGILEECEKN